MQRARLQASRQQAQQQTPSALGLGLVSEEQQNFTMGAFSLAFSGGDGYRASVRGRLQGVPVCGGGSARRGRCARLALGTAPPAGSRSAGLQWGGGPVAAARAARGEAEE
jgi:hypothetical protein